MTARLLHIIVLFLTPVWCFALTFDEMVASMTSLSLPQVNVEIYADTVSFQYFVPGKITIAEYNDSSVTTTDYNCLIRQRGKTALFLPKLSYAIKLVDENGEKLDANLLGLRNDNSWILNAMGIDKLRMRDRVCFDIWNEFSHTMWDTKFGNRNGTVGTMVEVFVNGEYNGIYCLSDKINRQLLNLRKAKENDDGTVTIKGLLYKGKSSGLSNNLLDYIEDRTDTLKWNTIELQYPDEYPSAETWQPLMDLIDFNGKTDDEYFKAHYNEWYYVENLVDYWILLVAFGIDDMPYKNTFLSVPDINFTHRYMITPWDLDACFGRASDGSIAYFYSSTGRLNAYGPYNRLIAQDIDGIKNRIARRWLQLIEAELNPDNVESHINAIAQRYVESGAWQREYELWKDEVDDTRVIIGENINDEIEYVMGWYRNNLNHMTLHLDKWRDDYVEEDVITSHTITRIYNYLLGIDTTYYDDLDINCDGGITSNDITAAYDFLLGNY
jgi:hypothetical protein